MERKAEAGLKDQSKLAPLGANGHKDTPAPLASHEYHSNLLFQHAPVPYPNPTVLCHTNQSVLSVLSHPHQSSWHPGSLLLSF